MIERKKHSRSLFRKFYVWVDGWCLPVEASLVGAVGAPGNLLVVKVDGQEVLRRGFEAPLRNEIIPFKVAGASLILRVCFGHGPVFDLRSAPGELKKRTIWRSGRAP